MLKENKTYNQIFDTSKSYEGYLNCCLINKKSNDFWLNITNSGTKSITANFKLHLAWLSPRITLEMKDITFDQISSFDLTLFDQTKFNECLEFLIESISEFQAIYTSANLINMAKSGDFTKHIIEKLELKY